MMIHDMAMYARREWLERVARVEAMQSRGRMAHPPTCEWPLGGGHDYACFLSHCALAASITSAAAAAAPYPHPDDMQCVP